MSKGIKIPIPKPIPVEEQATQYVWFLRFWLVNSASTYTTITIPLKECEVIKEKIQKKQWFYAPMVEADGATIYYDGALVYAFRIDKVLA